MFRSIILLSSALLLSSVAGAHPARRDRDRRAYVVTLKPGRRVSDFVSKANVRGYVEDVASTSQGAIVQLSDTVDVTALEIDSSVAVVEESVAFFAPPKDLSMLTLTNYFSPTDASQQQTTWAQVQQELGMQVNGGDGSLPLWHLDRLDQRGNILNGWYNASSCGNGVNIYVVDTGVNVALSEFGGRASVFYPVNDVEGDGHGHGTFTAALAAGNKFGAAKCANIMAVRVLDKDGSGDTLSIVKGLDAVLNLRDKSRPSIVSMSLSGNGRSAIVEWYISALLADNVLVVTAAGNSPTGDNACHYSPGASPSSLTVGASDIQDQIPYWSNRGPCVKIFAPGRDIFSVINNGSEQLWNGTSMSAPLVSGVAAMLWEQEPRLSARQVFRGVINSATSGVLNVSADGSPDKLAYVGTIVAPSPSANDLQSLRGNTVTKCVRSCSFADFNLIYTATGILGRGAGNMALFRSYDDSSTYVLGDGVYAYGIYGVNQAGLRFVNGQAYYQLPNGSRQAFSGAVFVPSRMSIFFYDNVSGNTFYIDPTTRVPVVLTPQQTLWLYSWRQARFVKSPVDGMYWFKGIEDYFDAARRRWTPGSTPVAYQSARRYWYIGASPAYWLGGEVSAARWRYGVGSFTTARRYWSPAYSIPSTWADSRYYWGIGSFGTSRYYWSPASTTLFFDSTSSNLLASDYSISAVSTFTATGTQFSYQSLRAGSQIWDVTSATSAQVFGAANTWAASDSCFYANAADFPASSPGFSPTYVFDASRYYGYFGR